MNVKTITAPTIHAALLEARRQLGDDVVLLESIPPQGSHPARITVMADDAAPKRVPQRTTTARPAAPAAAERARPAFGYAGGSGTARQPLAALAEENAPAVEGFSRAGGSGGVAVPGGDGGEAAGEGDGYAFSVGARTLLARRGEQTTAKPGGALLPSGHPAPGRGHLFPTQAQTIEGNALQPGGSPSLEGIESLLQAQLKLLHERLDLIERRFEGAIIGAAQRWTVNPLFGALLDEGMRPATVTRLFDGLATKGYQPDTNPEALKWALAQEMRRTLNLATPKQTNGAQVFIGPSGAGKTSLVLKLARHPGFYARHRTAVIVILPEEEDGTFYQSPVELFRRHGVPVTTVRSLEEMRQAVLRVQHFDQILIDTPPMPVHEAAARKMLLYVKQLVDPIMPLTVQFVVNATRAIEDLDLDYVKRLGLRPNVLALTHLDETFGWGRIAEWLMAMKMPVQFASTSPRVPDGVVAFSSTWFVEEMMKL